MIEWVQVEASKPRSLQGVAVLTSTSPGPEFLCRVQQRYVFLLVGMVMFGVNINYPGILRILGFFSSSFSRQIRKIH